MASAETRSGATVNPYSCGDDEQQYRQRNLHSARQTAANAVDGNRAKLVAAPSPRPARVARSMNCRRLNFMFHASGFYEMRGKDQGAR